MLKNNPEVEADILDSALSKYKNEVLISVIFCVDTADTSPCNRSNWRVLKRFATEVLCSDFEKTVKK